MLKFIVGLILVVAGGEVTIRSVSTLSDNLSIRRAFMGLVIVAFGTSLPEFAVSLLANIKGSPGVAVGNILGSFSANMGLVIGIPSVLKPLSVKDNSMEKESFLMLFSVLLLFILSLDGRLGRFDGILLLALFFVFLLRVKMKENLSETDRNTKQNARYSTYALIVLTFTGFLLLAEGANLMVEGAKLISLKWHIAEIVLGSIFVAIGTSIPELVASISAAFKGEDEIALGNVVGSNIFNLLFILGTVSLVRPLPVGEKSINYFFPFMLLLSILFIAKLVSSGRFGRCFGLLFLVLYLCFIYIL